MTPHLVVDISAHGFGHLAQVAPVLEALARRLPALRLTLRTALARERLERRVSAPFAHLPVSLDVGAAMRDALTVDREASRKALLAFHRDWEARVAAEASALARLAPTALLADVPYLSLAAAKRTGVPALALCSLNWADIFAAMFAGDRAMDGVLDAMRAAYGAADVFLCPTPSMPMPWLSNVRRIGPVAATGRARGDELRRCLGLAPDTRLALLTLGGTPHRPLAGNGAASRRWHFLEQNARSDGATDVASVAMPFPDILASVDALIIKPGYGLFAEAAAAARPVLYLSRGDWAEEPFLVDWLRSVAVAEPLAVEELGAASLVRRLDALLAIAPKPPVVASGADEAAQCIARLLAPHRQPLQCDCDPS